MSDPREVSEHYTHGDLLSTIQSGVARLGKPAESLTIDDLAPVDEFHIGGREATEGFLSQLHFSSSDHVLDVGCGLGGPARFVAARYQSRVSGIDVTAEYVETAQVLCTWVGLDEGITLRQGSALEMPFPDGTFDGGYMIHVGMNIEDKAKLFAEVTRVLRPGGRFGVYDVMRVDDGELMYPLPWATTPATSAVSSPSQYKSALQEAGFTITAERDRADFALSFFDQLRAKTAGASGPPPLGLHLLMGASTPVKLQNMVENTVAGRISPVELIAQKAP